MPRNAFYAQSGGVTAVINASAAGVIETARKHAKHIGKVYAGRNGIIGALTEELIDTGRESPAAIREVGALRIDPRRRDATVAGRRLALRSREFDLLVALARDAGVVLTRDALLEDVWGTDFPGETRTVDVHVSEVRKKLRPDGPPIETLRGIGYRLVPPGREPLPDADLDGDA